MKKVTLNSANQPAGASSKDNSERVVEVLYQRLGDKWYAFSLIDDEVYVGSMEEVDAAAVPAEFKSQDPTAF